MEAMESITLRQARRLALVRAGLLKASWIGLPRRASGRGKRARDAAQRIIRHFGYLPTGYSFPLLVHVATRWCFTLD